jgi:uroporphyrinogen-III synthase
MTFLIARPEEKAKQTAAVFTQHGFLSQVLPILKIDIHGDSSLITQLNQSSPTHIIITSTYAVQWLINSIATHTVKLNFANICFVCVGAASANLLAVEASTNKLSFKTIKIAAPENSEGILRLPCLQTVKDKNIVLLKGEGGRDIIETQLSKRNAHVTSLSVYKRVVNAQAIQGFTFEPSQIRCIIATSIEIAELLLTSLVQNQSDKNDLLSCTWIVASERIKHYACENGIKNIVVSQGASDQALLECAKQIANTGVVHD